MKAIKYISFLLIVVLFSCNPEELPPVQTENPVFAVSGDLVNITAGEEDFYLFTDYEKDDMDVYSFVGKFAKTSDCSSNCSEELVIKIRDSAQNSGTVGVDIDNALTPGNYAYKVLNPIVTNDDIVVNLAAEPDGVGPFSYLWTITYIDSTINTFSYLTETVSLSFANNTNVSSLDVCLMVTNNNLCQIQYCNDIFLDPNADKCQADIQVEGNPAQLQLVASMENGTAPFSYLWSNGSNSDSITEPINSPPFNAIYCVTISDANGCTDDICKEITINQGGTAPIVCGSRFSYEKVFEPGAGDSLQLNTVLVQYTDEDGTIYRSDLFEQPNAASFVINSIEDFDNNENGDKTKKLNVSVNCSLFDANGAAINFPFEGIIAVAYP